MHRVTQPDAVATFLELLEDYTEHAVIYTLSLLLTHRKATNLLSFSWHWLTGLRTLIGLSVIFFTNGISKTNVRSLLA
jgi:hypothetical protein